MREIQKQLKVFQEQFHYDKFQLRKLKGVVGKATNYMLYT